jgi:hypothetical protein
MKPVRPAAFAAASVLLFSTSSAVAAPPPPDLGGVNWRASQDVAPTHGTPGAPGDVVTTTERTCDPFGNATLSMTAIGTAEGPYPGTFKEQITVALSRVLRAPTDRDVLSASGTFTIDSELGQVEGSLLFARAQTPAIGDSLRSGATGWCLNEPEFPGSPTVTPQTELGGAMTAYEATITTPDGCVFVDHGGDADPADDTVFAGGFDLRAAPFPQGRTVFQGFQSDGAPLEASAGCETPSSFEGFFPPVDNLWVDNRWVLNEVNAGQAIPVKFSLGGDQGVDIFAAGYPRSETIPCSQIALVDGVEETVTAGSSSLTYSAETSRYHYVWKTEPEWSDTCRQFVMKLNDGSVHRANFSFK